MSLCCIDLNDVELFFGRVSGYDVIFDLTDFNPARGDYYTIVNGVATLVVGSNVPLTDMDGNILTDPDGNTIYVEA